jgi:hypothetical protein
MCSAARRLRFRLNLRLRLGLDLGLSLDLGLGLGQCRRQDFSTGGHSNVFSKFMKKEGTLMIKRIFLAITIFARFKKKFSSFLIFTKITQYEVFLCEKSIAGIAES